MKSITYWHPSIYSFLIKLSYGRNYSKRYETIRNLIEEGSSVVDVCCGDCKMYEFLKEKKVKYTGLDSNSHFINIAQKKGINARVFNMHEDKIPEADYVLLLGSLYQFIPGHDRVLQKLFHAARKYLIISETVKNYADSKSKVVSFISVMLNNPGDGFKRDRFNIDTFREAIKPFRENIEKEFLTSGDLEYVVVVNKDGKRKS